MKVERFLPNFVNGVFAVAGHESEVKFTILINHEFDTRLKLQDGESKMANLLIIKYLSPSWTRRLENLKQSRSYLNVTFSALFISGVQNRSFYLKKSTLLRGHDWFQIQGHHWITHQKLRTFVCILLSIIHSYQRYLGWAFKIAITMSIYIQGVH